MNLTEVPEGSTVRIARVVSGRGLLLRLRELGIFEGASLTVVRNSRGPVILRVFGSTLAIGRMQAARIEVEK